MASAGPDKNEERRKRVFVGKLPPDFLRLHAKTTYQTSQEQQEAADAQAALALQQQLVGVPVPQNATGRLSITVAQAKLVKNYGMARMDPYVRLRVGHCIYETHTDPNGGKNPKWNRVVQCLLPQGINSIYLQIFDECSFTMDELIAWAQIPIPQNVMDGETYEDWFPLSGKQGDGMEGMVNLVISFTPGPYGNGVYPTAGVTPFVMGIPSGAYGFRAIPQPIPVTYTAAPVPVPPAVAPVNAQPQPPIHLSLEDLKQIEEMFPNMDKDIVKSVYEANRGNKDLTVNTLLQMSD